MKNVFFAPAQEALLARDEFSFRIFQLGRIDNPTIQSYDADLTTMRKLLRRKQANASLFRIPSCLVHFLLPGLPMAIIQGLERPRAGIV